jgi:hypothetical protein
MAVIASRSQLDGVKAALDGVRSNGQALAAIDSSMKSAMNLAGALLDAGGAFRENGAKQIGDALAQVQKARDAVNGMPTTAVGQSWQIAREKVQYLWSTIFVLQSTMPPGEDLGEGFGTALLSALVDLPATIGNAAGVALKTAVKIAAETAKGVGQVGGSLIWAFLKPIWPVLLIAGVGVGGFYYAKRRGLIP